MNQSKYIRSKYRTASETLWTAAKREQRKTSRAPSEHQPVKEMGMGGRIFWIHDRRSTVQGFTKRWALGCEKFVPSPAWLLLNKTGPPFSESLYIAICQFATVVDEGWSEEKAGCLTLLVNSQVQSKSKAKDA